MTEEIKKMPKTVVGALIMNKNGKFLIIRSPKWKTLAIPGGHVEFGERVEDALIREIKEEVGLEIENPQFLQVVEIIKDENFNGDEHFIGLEYLVKTEQLEDAIKMDNEEITEYFWLSAEEILKREDTDEYVKQDIQIYLERKHRDKHSMFHRACKDCEKAKAEAQEFKAGWQRALADYKNLQREVEQRRGEWAQMSEAQILEEFLPVYDNFKKAFEQDFTNGQSPANSTNENWMKGIECIKKQFAEVLKQHGIEEIKTVGEKFDPALHEAGGEEYVEGKESGEIVREVSGGYKMGGKVIRAARVIVAK